MSQSRNEPRDMAHVGVIYCRHHYPSEFGAARMHPRLLETLALLGVFAGNPMTVNCHEAEELPSPDCCSVWIVSGEPYSWNRDSVWMRDLDDFLRNAMDGGARIFGIGGGERIVDAALLGNGAALEASEPAFPVVRNPLIQFGSKDSLYRYCRTAGRMVACAQPQHYRDYPRIGDAFRWTARKVTDLMNRRTPPGASGLVVSD